MKKQTPESIISLYKDDENFGFVLDIEQLTKFINDLVKDKDNTPEEQTNMLFGVLKHNNEIYRKCKKLQESSKRSSSESEESKSTSTYEKSNFIETRTDICDVSSIINNICSCNNLDTIKDLLPKPTDPNYRKKISAVLLGIEAKEQEDTEFISNPENIDLKDDALELIERYHRIREIIIEYDQEKQALVKEQEAEEDTPDEEFRQRRIIFLRKPSGNYYIDADLGEIDEKDKLTELLWNIRNDSIKEIKRYNNPELKNLLGARDHKSRIFFMELDKDTVVIAGLMIKRFQNNEAFNDMLIARAKAFEEQKEVLCHLAEVPDFIKEQEEILANVIKAINSKGGKKRVIQHE